MVKKRGGTITHWSVPIPGGAADRTRVLTFPGIPAAGEVAVIISLADSTGVLCSDQRLFRSG